MSNGRRNLPQEELEIHNILSPKSGSSQKCDYKGVDNIISDQPQVLNAEALDYLIKDAIAQGIKTGLAQAQSTEAHSQNNLKRSAPKPNISQCHDSDLPAVGMNSVHEDMASHVIFGENINNDPNETEHLEEDSSGGEEDDTSYPTNGQNPPTSSAPSGPNINVNNNNLNEPDNDLPSVHPRPPPNWHPKKKIMLWLESAADKEWTTNERKDLKEKFHPSEEYDPLFLPVNMPPKLHKSLKSKITKRKDYLLNRELAEKNLFYASSDLCTALRPFTEAISKLDDIQGSGDIKI